VIQIWTQGELTIIPRQAKLAPWQRCLARRASQPPVGSDPLYDRRIGDERRSAALV